MEQFFGAELPNDRVELLLENCIRLRIHKDNDAPPAHAELTSSLSLAHQAPSHRSSDHTVALGFPQITSFEHVELLETPAGIESRLLVRACVRDRNDRERPQDRSAPSVYMIFPLLLVLDALIMSIAWVAAILHHHRVYMVDWWHMVKN